MELKNNKEMRGRPVYGAQAKTVDRKVRIEPYIDEELTYICRVIGITRAEGIRQGILLFIREFKRSRG